MQSAITVMVMLIHFDTNIPIWAHYSSVILYNLGEYSLLELVTIHVSDRLTQVELTLDCYGIPF